ncbi:MAG: hypothetical protein QM775_07230 [Pirellulales bacterium]
MHDARYPFGRLTIPWYLAGVVLAVWAFAPLYVYHVSFAAEDEGWGKGTVGSQDFAGYVGFAFVGFFAVVCTAALTVAHRRTFALSWPPMRTFVEPFVISTSIFAAPYGGVAMFYEQFRSSLPYDSNWAAISGICVVGLAQFVVMTALAKSSAP